MIEKCTFWKSFSFFLFDFTAQKSNVEIIKHFTVIWKSFDDSSHGSLYTTQLSSSDARGYQKSHETVYLSRLELDAIDIGNQLPFLSSSGMLLVMHCDYR